MNVTPGINRAKTWVLIAGLMGLFLLVGALIGGRAGMTIALVLGLVFNFAMYRWSDRSPCARRGRAR